jgi:hypothetical protein
MKLDKQQVKPRGTSMRVRWGAPKCPTYQPNRCDHTKRYLYITAHLPLSSVRVWWRPQHCRTCSRWNQRSRPRSCVCVKINCRGHRSSHAPHLMREGRRGKAARRMARHKQAHSVSCMLRDATDARVVTAALRAPGGCVRGRHTGVRARSARFLLLARLT